MDRRHFLTLTAALSVTALPPVAFADGTPYHPIFGHHRLAEATWVPLSGSHLLDHETPPSPEVQALQALLFEDDLMRAEGIFLNTLRAARPQSRVYDQDAWSGTFVGELHDGFVTLVAEQAREIAATTLLVSPMGLTLLQSAASVLKAGDSTAFLRSPTTEVAAYDYEHWLLKPVGRLYGDGVDLLVMCDPLLDADAPAVIGRVAARPEDRRVSVCDDSIGFAPGYADDFRLVGIKLDSISWA